MRFDPRIKIDSYTEKFPDGPWYIAWNSRGTEYYCTPDYDEAFKWLNG